MIKINHSEAASLKSLHDITLIKIKQRNIYAAYYTLDRLDRIPEGLEYVKDLKTFLEAAVHLMKKKFKEGVELLDTIQEESEIDENVKPLINSYRAFGNFSLGNIKKSLEDYKLLEKSSQQVDSDKYNMLLCKGIIACKERNFKEARQAFSSAKKLNQKSVEPGFYLAMLKIEMNFNDIIGNPISMEKMNFRVIIEVIKEMEEILKNNDSSSNLYFQLGKLKLMAGLIQSQ